MSYQEQCFASQVLCVAAKRNLSDRQARQYFGTLKTGLGLGIGRVVYHLIDESTIVAQYITGEGWEYSAHSAPTPGGTTTVHGYWAATKESTPEFEIWARANPPHAEDDEHQIATARSLHTAHAIAQDEASTRAPHEHVYIVQHLWDERIIVHTVAP